MFVDIQKMVVPRL